MMKKFLYAVLASTFLISSGYATEPIVKHLKTEKLINAYLEKTLAELQNTLDTLQHDCSLEEMLQKKDEQCAAFAPHVKKSLKKQLAFLNEKIDSMQTLLQPNKKKSEKDLITLEKLKDINKKLDMALDGRVSGQDIGTFLIILVKICDSVQKGITDEKTLVGKKTKKTLIKITLVSLVIIAFGMWRGWWGDLSFLLDNYNKEAIGTRIVGWLGFYFGTEL